MSQPLAAVFALLAGVFVAVQAAALAPLTRVVTPVVAAFWSQALGVLAAGALVLVTRHAFVWPGGAAPWALLAGTCTVVIVASIGTVVTPLGLAVTVATVTGAQLVTALLLDAVGVTGETIPLQASRLLGVLLIVVGVLILYRPTAA